MGTEVPGSIPGIDFFSLILLGVCLSLSATLSLDVWLLSLSIVSFETNLVSHRYFFPFLCDTKKDTASSCHCFTCLA